MLEITDTSRPGQVPEGEHIFTIIGVPAKVENKSGNGYHYEFALGYTLNGARKTWKANLQRWDLGVILEALGFKRVSPHEFSWDREECQGRMIKATIINEADKKDPKKIWPKIVSAQELSTEEVAVPGTTEDNF